MLKITHILPVESFTVRNGIFALHLGPTSSKLSTEPLDRVDFVWPISRYLDRKHQKSPFFRKMLKNTHILPEESFMVKKRTLALDFCPTSSKLSTAPLYVVDFVWPISRNLGPKHQKSTFRSLQAKCR